MLEKYVADNGFENILFLSDDGYSGTNFNRPAWKALMRMVENNEVATIIVKDMSRLGRDYLLIGQYTEMIFPSYGVRFIAVNNNVDSLYDDNDFTPFVNLFNDFYAKDTSRKIRAVAKSKAERGERAERYSRTAEQEIIIHYRDIGVVGAFAKEAEKIAEQRQRQTA